MELEVVRAVRQERKKWVTYTLQDIKRKFGRRPGKKWEQQDCRKMEEDGRLFIDKKEKEGEEKREK